MFWPISCTSGYGISELETQINFTFVSEEDVVPQDVAQMIDQLIQERKKKQVPLMRKEEFEDWIGSFFQVSEKKKLIQRKLIEWGFILDFSKSDIGYVILDPQWIAYFFLTIISAKSPPDKKQVKKEIDLPSNQALFQKVSF